MVAINDNELEKLCSLAKLKISQNEKQQFLDKMNSVFNWINQLEKIDVSNVNLNDLSETTIECSDTPNMKNTRNELLSNTKYKKFDMFSVPKIVE